MTHSRKDDLIGAFESLKLALKPHRDAPTPVKSDDKPKPPTDPGFVGGFNPLAGFSPPGSSYPPHDGGARPQYSSPVAAAMQMPVPEGQISQTMQHALFLASGPSPSQVPAPDFLSTSSPPSRPLSASVLPNPHISTSPRPKPSHRSSRPRASSVPAPTPVSPVGPNQCEGITKTGKRCTRQVKDGPALTATHPDVVVERFCHQHSKEVLGPSGFYSRVSSAWIKFEDYIPDYLSESTKVALRVEMEKVRSSSDVPGYIYTFEIRDPKTPKSVHLKVGRAVNLVKRIDQWGKQCGSKEQVLRGWWPGTVVDEDLSTDTSLMKGRVKAGEQGKWCHRLERLVHLELSDLVVSEVYLESGFRAVNGGGGYGSSADDGGSPKKPKKGREAKICADCGTAHKEIFTFTRIEKGRYKGKEWELIVKPIIEKWGSFINEHV